MFQQFSTIYGDAKLQKMLCPGNPKIYYTVGRCRKTLRRSHVDAVAATLEASAVPPNGCNGVATPKVDFQQSHALMFAVIPETSSWRPYVDTTPGDDDTPAVPGCCCCRDSTVAQFRRTFLRRFHNSYAAIPTTAFRQSHDDRPQATRYCSGARYDGDGGDPKQ